MTSAPVSVEVAEGIATLILHSSDGGNAIGLESARAFGHAVRRCREPEVRAVVLTGEGTAIGYTPDGGGSWLLSRIVGYRRALELRLLNRRLTATEALEWGLVSRIVPSDLRGQATSELAAVLADGATQALGATKRLAAAAWTSDLSAALRAESAEIAERATSPEGLEGAAAFIARRSPTYRSR